MKYDDIIERCRDIFISKDYHSLFEKRIDKLEETNLWVARLIIGTIILSVLGMVLVIKTKV